MSDPPGRCKNYPVGPSQSQGGKPFPAGSLRVVRRGLEETPTQSPLDPACVAVSKAEEIRPRSPGLNKPMEISKGRWWRSMAVKPRNTGRGWVEGAMEPPLAAELPPLVQLAPGAGVFPARKETPSAAPEGTDELHETAVKLDVFSVSNTEERYVPEERARYSSIWLK